MLQPTAERNHAHDLQKIHRQDCGGMEADIQGSCSITLPLTHISHSQALQLLEFLVKNGSERVVDDARSHLSLIRMLRQFHYIDQNGKDQGINVRNRSVELTKLLADVDTIRAERKKSRNNRNKYGGVEGGAGLGGGFSSGARYGGFGSESAGYGGYQGEVYGDGGGFGGRETDFSGTQRRGDNFEEYDAEEEGATSPVVRNTAAPAPKKEKAKEPVPDLFDFGDDEPATTSAGKAPATNLADLSQPQISTAADDDDFDDFQSAASPATAQPAISNFAALSPPPLQSSTSATQYAAPQPVAPAQTANLNSLFSAGSGTGSIASPPSTITSPPSQSSTPLQPANASTYKPSGPNYFTSVNTSINNTPSTTSAFSSRPATHPNISKPSYSSSTSAATLGKPVAKTSTGSGADVFSSLWTTASSKAGVQSKSVSKGPDLASMAKAKSEAGIWGISSGAGAGGMGVGQQRPGAIAPSPNTAAGQGRPAGNPGQSQSQGQSLGNGLDDLLG
jgi:epsin